MHLMKEGQSKGPGLFVKVTYKDSLFNFGKDIQSYQELVKSAKLRFPSIEKFYFLFKQQQITQYNFSTLVRLQSVQGQKSIKLQLKDKFQEKQIEKDLSKSKKYSFNPDDFDDQIQNERKQSLQEDFQVLSINDKQQKSSKKPINLGDINIKVLISKEFQCIETHINDQYFWQCNLVNLSKFDIYGSIFIKNLSTQEQIEILDFKNFQNRQFMFGPYTEKQVGKHLHFYQIIFKKSEQQCVPIGNKFGFLSDTKKKVIIKEIQNKIVQRVNKLRNFCICEKTTEYIVKMIKQLKITENSIDGFNDQDLIEMIESFNKN